MTSVVLFEIQGLWKNRGEHKFLTLKICSTESMHAFSPSSLQTETQKSEVFLVHYHSVADSVAENISLTSVTYIS